MAKVKNPSDTTSLPTTIDFYLSPSKRLEDSAHLLGSAELKRVAAGRRKASRVRLEVPDDVEPGAYFLATVVDGGKINYDLDRRNNVKTGRRVIIE